MIYTIIIILLVLFAIVFDFCDDIIVKKYHIVFYNFCLLIFIFIAAFRWKVGGDTINYQDTFERDLPFIDNVFSFYQSTNKNWEPLFVLLLSLSKTIINKFWFFQLIHAFVINIILFSFFKRYTTYKFTALLGYAFFAYWYFNMEILRESIAICIFIFSYRFYSERQWLKYYSYVVFAIFFHFSAIVLLLFPMFRNVKLNKYGIFILAVMFLAGVFLNSHLSFLLSILNFDEVFINRIVTYTSMKFNLTGLIFNILLFIVIPASICIFNRKKANFKFNDLLFTYFFIIIIFLSFNGFGRFINYLIPFMIVYSVETIRSFFTIKVNLIPKMVLIIVVMFFPLAAKISYYNKDTSNLSRDTKLYNLWVPYNTIFYKKEYYKREDLYHNYMQESLERVIIQTN